MLMGDEAEKEQKRTKRLNLYLTSVESSESQCPGFGKLPLVFDTHLSQCDGFGVSVFSFAPNWVSRLGLQM